MRYNPDDHRWSPWSVDRVCDVLPPDRWWLSGGVAVEWTVGTTVRPHGDLDISALRSDVPVILEALGPERVWAAHDGRLRPWTRELSDDASRNIWVQDASDALVLQINVEDGDDHRWIYRRCQTVTLPWAEAVGLVRGVRTGSLLTQLLWKAARPRRADELDLEAAGPLLSSAARAWLTATIAQAHPDSPWRHRFDSADG